jgi:hypothetical protein
MKVQDKARKQKGVAHQIFGLDTSNKDTFTQIMKASKEILSCLGCWTKLGWAYVIRIFFTQIRKARE